MIGVCYEAGLLYLARELATLDGRTHGGMPGNNKNHRPTVAKLNAQEYVAASSLEALAYDVLCAVGATLGDDLEWVRTCLRPTCYFVRTLRNSAGHPTGAAIAHDDVAAHILLLPAFLRRIESISATIRGLP